MYSVCGSGDYRLLYAIEDRRLVIVILKVGDRTDVYR
jgi:mRNA-degrading endonuclease RelE of RelBE toxin-antitoxin system